MFQKIKGPTKLFLLFSILIQVLFTGRRLSAHYRNPSNQSTPTSTGLCGDTYTVTVTDQNGCIAIDSIEVNEPLPLATSMIAEQGVDCFGDCDGYAEVSASNGTGPYTYQWSDGQIAALAINLCAGNYTVTITDANSCTQVDTAFISQPGQLANAFSTVNNSCAGDSLGISNSNVTGGTPPYFYLWNSVPIQTTASATGLISGIYSVQITDSNGCVLTDTDTITEPTPITLSSDTTGANCGKPDGSACITVSSGVAPFTYSWDTSPAQTTA